jgi:CheY-like chemotaxis protein
MSANGQTGMSLMSKATSSGDVIVADNDHIIRDILRSVLESNGFNVLLGVNGLEAIDLAMRTSARLVILDYKMPKLDGISACVELRRLPGYADTPILILTAFDDNDTRAAAQSAGVTALLGKPFKPVDLLGAVNDLSGATTTDRTVPEPSAVVWERHQEPRPLFGEPARLAEGRRVLNICRR